MSGHRVHRAGEAIEDYCRACKTDRAHTVIVVDGEGRPLRVTCDYCRSQHNFRGGPRIEMREDDRRAPSGVERRAMHESHEPPTRASRPASVGTEPRAGGPSGQPFPIVSDRERTAPPMSSPTPSTDLELLLRRVIREEAGITPAAPAPRWRGGTFVLRPGTPGLQEKSWPIETFFHKVVMLRNRLRTLEQHINASELPDDVKVKLQGYVSGCYGSLTSFNVLFADEADQFKGSGGE